ncbi:HsdM family class I SAM-dependent methyltransferase [Methylomonas sp. HW2-6]|uniref:HsdM family class I SAM-dependent methyltransferase n=1 Tax=Methylomonas sp. HW2-6 TaxID=3376687 RepID=UPI0040428835
MKMDWINELRNFGARSEDVVVLEGNQSPSILPYLDLVEGRSKRPLLMPEAVVEVQHQPLLYLYSEAHFSVDQQFDNRLSQIKRLMAMRGDAALIGILRHGVLELHSTGLTSKKDNQPVDIRQQDVDAGWLIPRLAQGNSPVPFGEKLIETELFRLLEESAKELREAGLPVAEIVSLTGRAVFLRFLLDREILPRNQPVPFLALGNCSPDSAFDNPQNAAATCLWLDQTFNGDLLPLPNKDLNAYFDSLLQGKNGNHIFKALQAILHFDDPLGDGVYQGRFNWEDLHLAHVPVGLLSQVYERYMEMFYPKERKATSAYYTPRHIAEIMVDEAFFGLELPHRAKVLDPAAGAGVFLVAAFHKLVEARWRQEGKRPNRAVLREILNQQIRGFDVNCHALKLAALSLYLTRLELDPEPSPMEALRFESLQGKVLFNWSSADHSEQDLLSPVAGSLGDHVGSEHNGAYDIVIGNPPWSAHDKGHKNLKKVYTDVSRRVAVSRQIPNADRYTNPDGVPDLPFLWRAMEWARPGGRIAFALHGRWLFKQSKQGIQSRNAILEALNITGILNGAALRSTEVWPRVTAPFCLVFAENCLPNLNAGFFFVSPQLDPALNKEGRLRIDAQAAEPVLRRDVIDKPWLLKSLFRGNRLSSSVIDKIKCRNWPTIEDYWKENKLALGEGYQSTASGTIDASYLKGRLDVNAFYEAHPFSISQEKLVEFQFTHIYRRKKTEIFQQPLVLVREGSRYDRNRGRALLVKNLNEIIYSVSFFGFSCFGSPQAALLAQYVLILFHSKFFLFFQLATSSRFGVERDASLTEDLRRMPFVPIESLNSSQKEQIISFANQMITDPSSPPWEEIDELVAEIYGLNRWDRQVIDDSLTMDLPDGTEESKQASIPCSNEQKAAFKNALHASMDPFFSVTGRELNISLCDNGNTKPWVFIDIDTSGQLPQVSDNLSPNILDKADDLMVSRIIQTWESYPGCLRVGILDQARYWTVTQARLLAADLLRNYGHQLEQGR